MDLREELLAVLSKPSRLWDSLVENLSSEPRVCLFVLATFPTPVDIIDWQQGVTKVSPEASVRFEAAIRALDDNFARIDRDQSGKTMVAFRNPSVEEFAAAQLDRNAGFATTVAANEPSLAQVVRLVQLGTARRVGRGRNFAYPNLHGAVIENPSALTDRLLALLPQVDRPSDSWTSVMLALMNLVGEGRLSHMAESAAVKDRLASILQSMSFNKDTGLLFKLLDDDRHANTVAIVLGDGFDEFYANLVESAEALTHFDSLMNLDQALDRSPEDASWAEKFEGFNDRWLEETDDEFVQSDWELYERIAEYLDLANQDVFDAWADVIGAAEESARNSAEPDDESWREDERSRRAGPSSGPGNTRFDTLNFLARASTERGKIDALFGSLPDSKSRD